MQDVSNRENCVCVCQGGGIWELVLSAQYFCKSKTALKIMSIN